MLRNVLKQPNNFCYARGELTFKSQRRHFSTLLKKKKYEFYFECKSGDFDKDWVTSICCISCVGLLNGWKSITHLMPLSIPMIWREQKGDLTDCYFCLIHIKGITSKKYTVKYPNMASAIRPVPHSEEYPETKFPDSITLSDNSNSGTTHSEHKRKKRRDNRFEASTS